MAADDKSWNELNELTLSVMANRSKYDKCKKTLANTTDTVQEAFRKEKMYYKDRILNMTKDLFHERCENDTMNHAHQEYLKSCIEYLKWNDITDMVSDDKRNEVRDDGEIQSDVHTRGDDLIHARDELQQKIQATTLTPDDPDDDTSAHSSPQPQPACHKDIMSIANKMCIRKKTIDDFIVLKPSVNQTDEHINARLPKVRDYHGEIMKRASALDDGTS
jgi:spore maturation protein CgeB